MSHIMAFSIKCTFLLGSYKAVRSPRRDMRKKKKLTRSHDLLTRGNELVKSWERVKFFSFACTFVGSIIKLLNKKNQFLLVVKFLCGNQMSFLTPTRAVCPWTSVFFHLLTDSLGKRHQCLCVSFPTPIFNNSTRLTASFP